jgi:hypothetical protein
MEEREDVKDCGVIIDKVVFWRGTVASGSIFAYTAFQHLHQFHGVFFHWKFGSIHNLGISEKIF